MVIEEGELSWSSETFSPATHSEGILAIVSKTGIEEVNTLALIHPETKSIIPILEDIFFIQSATYDAKAENFVIAVRIQEENTPTPISIFFRLTAYGIPTDGSLLISPFPIAQMSWLLGQGIGAFSVQPPDEIRVTRTVASKSHIYFGVSREGGMYQSLLGKEGGDIYFNTEMTALAFLQSSGISIMKTEDIVRGAIFSTTPITSNDAQFLSFSPNRHTAVVTHDSLSRHSVYSVDWERGAVTIERDISLSTEGRVDMSNNQDLAFVSSEHNRSMVIQGESVRQILSFPDTIESIVVLDWFTASP